MNIDRERINNLATKIRLALDIAAPPYDPHEAIIKLHGKVLYDIQDLYTDAYIEKLNNEEFCIHLNQNRHKNRERFTLAHELGHLFMHMGYLIDSAKWNSLSKIEESVFYRDNSYSIDEYEANEFAASFLMPKDEFIDVAGNYLSGNQYSLDPIAEYFDVSIEAVSNRGKWIGIFQW
jgi:Zn-dependent peptidase ImmA (M78 family)